MKRLIIRMLSGAFVVWVEYLFFPTILPNNWSWVGFWAITVVMTYFLDVLLGVWKKLTP